MTTVHSDPPPQGYRYLRLADEMEHQIASGVFKAGEKLPSIRKLHRRTGLSITTVYHSFIELEHRGLVESRLKSGYFVKPRMRPVLPAPKLKRHAAGPRKVTVGAMARSIVRAMSDPSMLQLGGTLAAPQLQPLKALHRSMKGIASRDIPGLLGTYAPPSGSTDLRRQIAQRWLSLIPGLDPGAIVVTGGCLEAVAWCLRAVAGDGDTIIVESPTYPWFLQLIEDLRMFAMEVPTDPSTGIDLQSLQTALKENTVAACLLVPNFHNPTGALMPPEKKAALADIMAKRRIPLIEDDIHGDLHFDPLRPAPIKAFDRHGMVLYCTSFSKTVAPGLRLGWVQAGRYTDRVRRLKLNGTVSSPAIEQHLLASFLKSGAYDRHLRRLRRALRNQASDLSLAVARHFPPGTRISAPRGGLTLWVELDARIDSLAVFEAARQARIAILPGQICSASSRFRNFIRLSYGFPWDAPLEKGLQTLGRIIGNQKRTAKPQNVESKM